MTGRVWDALRRQTLCYRTCVSDPNSKLPEFLKRVFDQQPELVKETQWSYVYKSGEKSYTTVSKFLADENFSVSAPEIRQRWPSMSEDERLDLVQNFWSKASWNSNDTEILEVIMRDGNDHLWEHCALAFLNHPDRDRAVSFLIERLAHSTDAEPLNYIQALGLTKDRRAVSPIKRYYETYRKEVEAESATGVPEDVVFGPIPYHAYFVACGALLRIEESPEFEQAIRKYLDHPHKQVRWWANHELQTDQRTA